MLYNCVVTVLLVFIAAFLWLWLKVGSKKTTPGPSTKDDEVLCSALELAISEYKKKRLAYSIQMEGASRNLSHGKLKRLEDIFGKAEGCPYLSLPEDLILKSGIFIKNWMIERGMPYNDLLPSLYQLGTILEEQVQKEAKSIIDRVVKEL